jgi:predicted ATP-dependent endonuclease of OLD family
MRIENIGCIGPEGLEVQLNDILTIVGVNNTGKSTILRAYELAVGTEKFEQEDRCLRAPDQPSSVEIWVHIPEGMANIAEKWKSKEGEHLVVRSKWEWAVGSTSKIRRTWYPEIHNYAEDDTASGLDTVFTARLPQPLRIGTLEDPEKEHQTLLKIVLQPIIDKLKLLMQTEDSELNKISQNFISTAQKPVEEEKTNINKISLDINKSHNAIFPNLSIALDIGLGNLEIDPTKLLINNSKIKFNDWGDKVEWNRQGTGSQRALFWSILQVRSRLKTVADIVESNKKETIDLSKQISKLIKDKESKKKEETIKKYEEDIKKLTNKLESLKTIDPDILIKEKTKEFSLPGYMLLIDEPEVGLHPNAIRAASSYLYNLATDPSWQIMITTHSPLFVNPLQDHTTILRVERDDKNITPKTYKSDLVVFSNEEKENLKMLNKFDQALAEMFFGPRPIVIEGDTEYAAFENVMKNKADYPMSKQPVLIRARGKDTINLIIRMLKHFEVSYSVLHDSDFRTKGVAWSANKRIYQSIEDSRKNGCKVIHRISIPTFEFQHLPCEYDKKGKLREHPEKEKPWNFISKMKESDDVMKSVKKVFDELISDSSNENHFKNEQMKSLNIAVDDWTKKNCPKDERFIQIKENIK